MKLKKSRWVVLNRSDVPKREYTAEEVEALLVKTSRAIGVDPDSVAVAKSLRQLQLEGELRKQVDPIDARLARSARDVDMGGAVVFERADGSTTTFRDKKALSVGETNVRKRRGMFTDLVYGPVTDSTGRRRAHRPLVD